MSGGGGSGIGALAAFRTLRMLRVFKLATKSETMLILISAIVETLKDVAYFCLLLGLYIFICALMGLEAYAYNVKVNNLDDVECVTKGSAAWD